MTTDASDPGSVQRALVPRTGSSCRVASSVLGTSSIFTRNPPRTSGFSIWLWLCLALLACSAPPAPRVPEAAPELVATAQPRDEAESGAAPPEPRDDTSLDLAVYRAAGVPELDRPWSPDDYERCLQVFGQLLRGGRGDLPRQGSARSGALFARLVNVQNFEATSRAAGSPGDRARALERQLESFPGLLQVYSPANDGVDFAREQADLGVALLELLKLALASSSELAPQERSWVQTYERQKVVTVGVVRGLEQMLGERERYPEPLRRRLKGELSRLAPELERHLDPDDARLVHAAAD
jgi:hypothetical protein